MQYCRWGLTRAEGENRLLQLAGCVSFDAAQGAVGLLGCRRTLLGHVELLVNTHPEVLLLRAGLDPLSAQPVFVLGIALTHVQDLALGLVEVMRFTEAQFSSLTRSLWMASLHSSVSTT